MVVLRSGRSGENRSGAGREGIEMRLTVLGGGSWGTTVANLVARRHDTVIWVRNPDVATEIREQRTNTPYLPGFTLQPALRATDDFEFAVRHAEMLIVGVPTTAVRETVERARLYIHPWIPIVSLSKGLERDSHLTINARGAFVGFDQFPCPHNVMLGNLKWFCCLQKFLPLAWLIVKFN